MVLFRIIDSTTLKTINEHFKTRGDVLYNYPHVSNKMIIENKNKEIAETTLFLIRNNKFNIQLIKKLQELHDVINPENMDVMNLFEFMINSIEEKVRENITYLKSIRKAVITASRRKNPLEILDSISVEACGKSRILLGGLASELHRRNLRALYFRTIQNEEKAYVDESH